MCLIGALFEVQHARLPDRSFVAVRADQLNSAVPTGFREELKSTNQPPGSSNIQPAVAALPPAATDARTLAGGTFAATETSVRRAADEEEIQTLKQGAGKKDGAKKVEEDQPTWMSQRKATFDELVADGANKVETRVEGHFLGGPVSMVYGEDHPTWWADQAHGKFNVQEAYDVVMAVKVSQRKAKFEELVAAGGVPSAGKKTIPPPDVGAAGLRTAETQCDNNGLLTSGNGQQQDAHKEFIQKLESNWENKMQLMSTDASAPVLKFQLRPGEPKVNVYIWNDGEPTNKLRELRLLAEGLIQHPAVELVSSPETARLVMWPTTMASWEKEVIPAGCKNLVLLDYSDGCNRHPRRGELKNEIACFKRGMAQRMNGVFQHECGAEKEGIKQYLYSGSMGMLRPDAERDLYDIVCTLRPDGFTNYVRKEVVEWTNQFIESHKGSIKALNSDTEFPGGGPGVTWESGNYDSYLTTMRRSRIVVTMNPAEWEGDFRLWEAMTSGALVFVDWITAFDRMPNLLVHKQHVIIYTRGDKAEFLELLEYYFTHPDEARKIAKAGHDFVRAHHMAPNRIDYVLTSLVNDFHVPL